MPLWPESVILEAVKAAFGLALLASGWFIGQRIIARWELRKKRRELDVNTAVQFQQLYGELKEVGRLWREAKKPRAIPLELPKDLRWSLLARGAAAESKFEAVVMKLASERELTDEQCSTLGLFRQACQQLRQSIRDDAPVSWSDLGPEYRLFNDLAAEVTCLIAAGHSVRPVAAGVACSNLEAIARVRSSRWKQATESYRRLYPDSASDKGPATPPLRLSASAKLKLPSAQGVAKGSGG